MASSVGLGFATGVVWRAASIGCLSFAAVLAARSQLYATALVLGLVIVLIGIDLIRASRSADQVLAQFVDAVAAHGYEWPVAPRHLDRLAGAMRNAQRQLESGRAERQQRIDFLESLIDTSPVALLVIDDHGRGLHANRAALRLGFHAGAPLPLDVGPAGSRGIVRLDDGRAVLMQVSGFQAPAMVGRRLVALQSVISDLDLIEIKAQQDLVRILAHEMMNSLTPITSLSESLLQRLQVDGAGMEQDDLRDAIEVISRRSSGLMSFVERYRRVAQVQTGVRASLRARDLAAHLDSLVGPMMTAAAIDYASHIASERQEVQADIELLEQALLNLLINARDAVQGTANPLVRLECAADENGLVFSVVDNGPGLRDPEAAFVPFYTTKPNGSGIGLTLARQIAAAHGGRLDYQRGELTVFKLYMPRSQAPIGFS